MIQYDFVVMFHKTKRAFLGTHERKLETIEFKRISDIHVRRLVIHAVAVGTGTIILQDSWFLDASST